MKKLSAMIMAIALISSASVFAEGKAHPCKGLKGKEKAECVKTEREKHAASKEAAKPVAKDAVKEVK